MYKHEWFEFPSELISFLNNHGIAKDDIINVFEYQHGIMLVYYEE